MLPEPNWVPLPHDLEADQRYVRNVTAKPKEAYMSLFMDVHNIAGGVSVDDVAGAHNKDLETQGRYGMSYLKYRIDELKEGVPRAQARRRMGTKTPTGPGERPSLPTLVVCL